MGLRNCAITLEILVATLDADDVFLEEFIAEAMEDCTRPAKKTRRAPERWSRRGKYTTTDVAEKILGGYYAWQHDLDDDANLRRDKEFRARYRVPYSV